MTRITAADHDGAVSEPRDALKDLRERLRGGQIARVEEALAERPDLAGDDEAVLELILVEMAARDARGESISIAEWDARLASLFADADRREAIRRVLTSEMETLSEAPRGVGETPAPGEALAKVGQYQLLEEIGRGGMGVVYKARQVNLNRIVALKMILGGDRAGPRDRARLRNEAEAAARISHPNIVQIIESDEHQGLPFLAMEHVDGGTLTRMLRSTPQPIRWACRLTETLARALHVAHQAGVVHRDLNPSNILMTQKGAPKIGDFGLAKILLADAGISLDGVMLGTPSYMAPEQIANGGKNVGPTTDVYALGAVLYEMLTGSPPFRGLTPMETLCQVAEGEVVLPSKIRRGLPRDLETICLKCLERDPARRYASARDLADDLRRFLDRQPIRARRASRRRRAFQWAQREPLSAGLLALCLTLLGSLLGLAAFHGVQLREYGRELEKQAGMISGSEYMMTVSKRTMERAELLSQRRWRDLSLGRIYDLAQRGETEVALELLDRLGAPVFGTDDFAWRYVDRLLRRSALVLGGEAHRAPVERLAASRDGLTLVTGDAEGLVIRWSVDGDRPVAHRLTGAAPHPIRELAIASDESGAATAIATIGVDDEGAAVLSIWDATDPRPPWTFRHALSEAADLTFSRAGDRLAFRRRSTDGLEWGLRIHEFRDGEWTETPKPTTQGATRLLFSPAANLLATGRADGSLRTLDLDSDLEKTFAIPAGAVPQALAFSSDGARLAAGCDDQTVWVWDLESGALLTSVVDLDAPAASLAFLLDDQLLLIRDEDGTVSTLDFRESPPSRRPLKTPGRLATLAAVSPDGRRFALAFAADRPELWDAVQLDAGPRPLGGLEGAENLAFGPDGRLIFVNYHDAPSFALKTTPEPWPIQKLAGHARKARAVAFSPDGAILATSGDDRQIKLWDVAGGAELAAIRAHDRPVSGLAFSPKTGELASVGLDGSLKVWTIDRDESQSRPGASLTLANELRPPGPGALRCVSFSSDGALLAASGDRPEILIFDREGDRPPLVVPSDHREAVTALAFSPSAPATLASVSLDATLKIWEPSTGARLDAKRVNGPLLTLAYAPMVEPAPSLLIAAGERRVVNAWDTRNRNETDSLLGHPRGIRSLAFSPDGLIFATGCDDGAVRLCDSMTSQIVLALEGHLSGVTAVAFSPDASTLASCGADGEVLLWRAGPPR